MTTKLKTKLLKLHTLKCPNDKETLHFHCFQGMRLKREVKVDKPKHNYYVYDATCPTCGEYYEVKAPK